MKRPSERNFSGVLATRGSPTTTVLPPPRSRPASEFLYVMPSDSRRTSVSAASSLGYAHIRIPPNAGPSVVSWIAMIARRPESRSLQTTICSWSAKRRTKGEYNRGQVGGSPGNRLPPAAVVGDMRRVMAITILAAGLASGCGSAVGGGATTAPDRPVSHDVPPRSQPPTTGRATPVIPRAGDGDSWPVQPVGLRVG